MAVRSLFRVVVLAAMFLQTAGAQSLDELSRSDVWQVRYCVIIKAGYSLPDGREILERLSADPHPSVAREAFAVYSNACVDVKPELAAKAFERGDFDLTGALVDDRNVFTTYGFWLGQLRNSSDTDADRVRPVRALGLLFNTDALPELSKISSSDNPYFLWELAKAFRRLGDDKAYLRTLETILSFPVENNISYKTMAIDCLLQTHPSLARPAWERVDKELEQFPDMQPNWMSGHVLQKYRLPK